MNRLIVAVFGAFLFAVLPAFAQPFRINPAQIDVILSPGFNHLPVVINVVSNGPGFDLNALEVTSDAAWVKPVVDVATSKIILNFATSNLVSLTHTATLTARQGAGTNVFFVNGALVPLNVTKLVDDPVRSRVYGLHLNGLERGNVLVIEPLSGNTVGSLTVGRKPTDLAVSRDGKELFVINSVDQTITIIDLQNLFVTEIINVPGENWGAQDTAADIEVGSGNILYYSDGAWAPVLRVFDRSTGQVLQSVAIDSNGFGDFALTPDFKTLIAWAQYGWTAGWGGSYAARFTVDATGLLTLAEKTDGAWPTTLTRDPLDTPVLFTATEDKVFVKQLAFNSGTLRSTLHAFPNPVYSISPGGEIAGTATALHETESGNSIYTLPVTAPVQVITSDYARFVYFDPNARAIRTINLLSEIGPKILKRKLAPTDGSIILPPDRLGWPPLAGIDYYQVYLGSSREEVASAGTNSPVYLGMVRGVEFFLPAPLNPGVQYFWRVDAVNENETVRGDIHEFTVSSFSSSVREINVATVQGHRSFQTSFEVQSQPPGQRWHASAALPWISFTQTNGVTPGIVTVVLDASQLPVGFNSGEIVIDDGTNAVFTLPVKLRVEPLRLTHLKSDPASEMVYGINEDPTNPAAEAYLFEINTRTEGIERIIPVGNSVTDLAVHNGDNRIYVPNWMGGALLAVNKDTFVVERTYPFRPFAGTGYGDGDVFKVAAWVPGRLIIEEQDQWIDITIFDTAQGKTVAQSSEREGGGAIAPGGRFYYHGDNNSSGAHIHKFDVTGDSFNRLASARVESVSYSGDRTVVVSDDGQRIFWNGSVFNEDLVEEWTIRDRIYSATPDGRYAFGADNIYDIAQRRVALGMPGSTAVSAFNSTTRKLVAQVDGSIRFYPLPDPVTLPAPVLSLASVTESAATLRWTDRSLETGFTLQKRLAGDSVWVNAASPPQNTNQWVVAELNRESLYEFRIKADAPGISSDWSPILTVSVPGAAPSRPTLDVVGTNSSSVTLQWYGVASGIELFLERRTVLEGQEPAWTTLPVTATQTNTYKDTAVISSGTYEYQLKATNRWGTTFSSLRRVTIPQPSPPAAPVVLDARLSSTNSVEISWSESDEATGYMLERRTDNPNSWIQIAELAVDTLTYVDGDVVSATEYWYRVKAFNSSGSSGYSPTDSVIVSPVLATCIVGDTFDPVFDPTAWAEISGGVVLGGVEGFDNGNALWFGTNTVVRSATTVPVAVLSGTVIEFRLRAGNEEVDGGAYWNNSEVGEQVVVEYSLDGFTWVSFQVIDTAYPKYSRWTDFKLTIPTGAASVRTQFRWRQAKHSGTGYDTWAIDDVCIRGLQPSSLSAPSFLMASATSSTSVALLWFASPGASYYVVERKIEGDAWMPAGVVPASQTYFTDTTAMPGSSYAYRVKAATKNAESAPSPAALATTLSQTADWLHHNVGDTNAPLTGVGYDGVPNIIRFAYNLAADAPLTALNENGTKGIPRIWFDWTRRILCAEFPRRRPETHPGVVYRFQTSADLVHWTDVIAPSSSASIDSIWERVRFEAPHPTGMGDQLQFSRVVVEIQ